MSIPLVVLGISGDCMYLGFYHSAVRYNEHYKLMAFRVFSAWAWCMLGVNTVFTGLMIWKIVSVLSPWARPTCD